MSAQHIHEMVHEADLNTGGKMKPLEGLLTKDGAASSMRVGMLMCITTACAIAIYTVYDASVTPETNSLILRLLIAGFAGKAIQKYAEIK